MVEEKRGKTEQRQQQQTLSEKKEEAGNVSEQRDKGRIHVIRVHDTTHLAVTTTLPGFQARSKDQEILEEGGGAGPSLLPRRDHE